MQRGHSEFADIDIFGQNKLRFVSACYTVVLKLRLNDAKKEA